MWSESGEATFLASACQFILENHFTESAYIGPTSREQTFDPRLKWALVPEFFAPGTRNAFSPSWCLLPGLKVPAPMTTAPDRGGRDL